MTHGPVIGTLLAGLTVGLVIGLWVAWEWWPVQFTNADPVDLRASYKDDYIRMIGAAYEMDLDLTQARRRLYQLGAAGSSPVLNAQVTGGTPTYPPLVHLAQALTATPQTAARPTLAPTATERPALVTPRAMAQATPGATPTSGPTLVPAFMATPGGPLFKLVERTRLLCSDAPETGILRIFVRDARGHDLPNVGIEIHWSNGDETIYTGLKPERGVGYADYEAAPDTFTVAIQGGQSEPAGNLLVAAAPANCRTDRGVTVRGWKLVFQQHQ